MDVACFLATHDDISKMASPADAGTRLPAGTPGSQEVLLAAGAGSV